MNSSDLLVVLAFIVRLAARSNCVMLHTPLKPKELVHLVNTQTLGIMNEKPSKDAGADQACCKEDVYAPAHAGIHLGQGLGDY